ncbi:hypothetical protein OK015_09520 [Mycobacterium sp. Aquia_216]|uniref:hypothetical protein n=1 Tax=Mycobacterium sp. Aquia_216 TaxID=2991729 RepID=UPI00227B3FB3|nr:hypothetical protein [Mycobacterium sp. Aquia_216]WAJ46667.1 hypothetical protein OK015_09520 [Mycobacterium sp. Aquia_216]
MAAAPRPAQPPRAFLPGHPMVAGGERDPVARHSRGPGDRVRVFGRAEFTRVSTYLEFIRQPTARNWYRAHNASIAAAYLANQELARREARVERFFINVVLIRVLYAHALVAAPRLALSWLAPFGRPLGDPRLGMTGIFLSLSRILPDRYPLGDDVETYIALEYDFGHMLDVGVIQPRWVLLYDWSSDELSHPTLRDLLTDGTPSYAWDIEDAEIWRFEPALLARAARRIIRP